MAIVVTELKEKKPQEEVASAAVKLAKAQIGDPYVWAAPSSFKGKDPGSFDCSGLVGWAWYKASDGKVNLEHYSGSQYQQTKRVKKKDLQPGDLIFFGKAKIHHVAMYVGNGKFVDTVNLNSALN